MWEVIERNFKDDSEKVVAEAPDAPSAKVAIKTLAQDAWENGELLLPGVDLYARNPKGERVYL